MNGKGNKSFRYDIIKELFNISVGKAASMLSEIINKKIILNVPDIEILNTEDKKFKFDDTLPKMLYGTLMVSSITFKEKLTGEANLIFPAEKMRTFINLCMNDEEEKSNSCNVDFTDIDFDIIKEVGNIILNSIIGEVGNYLDIDLNYTLPDVKVFDRIDFNKDIERKEYTYILMLYVTFIVDGTEIEGAILIQLTFESLNEMMEKVKKLEGSFYE